MANRNNSNDVFAVAYGIQDSIVADPEAIFIPIAKLFYAPWPWVVFERNDSFTDAVKNCFGQFIHLLLGGADDADFIAHPLMSLTFWFRPRML
jgi:hypothetical protein